MISGWFIALFVVIGLQLVAALLRFRDRQLMRETKDRLVRSGQLRFVSTRHGHKLAVRYTMPRKDHPCPRKYPVVIPNGLAATLATIGAIQDALVKEGFSVLSYDRLGVGLSDENKTGKVPTVEEVNDDLYEVMCSVAPATQKWILFGPSMGSIAGQCFLGAHSDMVVAFMNLDGLAHPFHHLRKGFLRFGMMYKFNSYVAYTGMMRPMLFFMRSFLKKFESSMFSVDFISAQMNSPEFYYNVGIEMVLMMDQAKRASDLWGPVSLDRLDDATIVTLASVRPTQNGLYAGGVWTPLPRSRHELGTDWALTADVAALKSELLAKATSPLAVFWQSLVVRSMSSRFYDYPGGKSFMKDEFKMKAAAEHAMLTLLAKNGVRYTFPTIGHNKLFLEVECAVKCVVEIDEAL